MFCNTILPNCSYSSLSITRRGGRHNCGQFQFEIKFYHLIFRLDFLTVFTEFHVDNDFPISSWLFSNKQELVRCHDAAADKHPFKGRDKLVHSSPATPAVESKNDKIKKDHTPLPFHYLRWGPGGSQKSGEVIFLWVRLMAMFNYLASDRENTSVDNNKSSFSNLATTRTCI